MDELGEMILGQRPKKESSVVAPKKNPFSGVNPQLQAEPDVDELGQLILGGTYSESKPQPTVAQKTIQNLFEAKKQAPAFLSSLGDVVAGAPSALAQTVGYGAGRLFGLSPQEAESAAGKVAHPLAQPFGRMTGTAETQAYKQALPTQVMDYIGQNLNEGAESIAKKFGLPVQDVQQGINAALMVATPLGAKGLAKGYGLGKEALQTLRIEPVKSGLQSGGAAAVVPENVTPANIQATLAQFPTEHPIVEHISKQPVEKVNLPALETKALEEKHGVNLTTGQRTNDTQLYSSEWNKRGETPELGAHFNEQPTQVANAFEMSKQKHAPDIPSTADASELGQLTINALAEKDALRMQEINSAYKALEDANGGQFPIDITALQENIKSNLQKKMKTNHLSSAIASDLAEFYSNPTFESYEALRTNLSNEMRSNSNGNARAAAYVVRQELENLPIFGEGTGTPQAQQLKALADNARKLYRDRQEILKSNPAYRAAVKEASSLEDVAAMGESLNADKFHKKFVANASPESIRRMKSEIDPDNIANQAIIFSELERAKNAAVNASGKNLTPEQFAKFYKNNKSALTESLTPQAMQDVTELGLLTSRIGMPKTGTFNYSNTYSGMLADMAKQGLLGLGEAKLATMTGGASVPAVGLTKQWMQKLNKEGFAKEALNPYGGLTKD